MPDFILLMHRDVESAPNAEMWTAYFATLRGRGVFDGGSAIGAGDSFRKAGAPGAVGEQISGCIRVRAADLAQARECLEGNPVFECGGTVEIRELPQGQ